MLAFRKMHGLGNDFIVFDARSRPLALTPEAARALADRHTGIGADTIVIVRPPAEPDETVAVTFINADGGLVSTCGNATRCVASLLFAETDRDHVRIATTAGRLEAWRDGPNGVAVDMGRPRFGWSEIPLARPVDTLHLPIAAPLADPVGVSMGNPHAVFFVSDADSVDLPSVGPAIEHHELFPERANVEVATVLPADRIRMRVWERGTGITRACGSGACATLVAAARRGLTGRRATILMDGGTLDIAWRDDDHVIMTGPAATAFIGQIDEAEYLVADPRAVAA
jgi:diaminopimelate epimerase